MKAKIILYLRYFLLGIVTATFLGYGVMLLMAKMTPHFLAWGFPAWSVYVIAAFEILGACGLHWKKVRRWSMIILCLLSMGAILTLVGHHVKWLADPWLSPIAPIMLLLSLFGIMYFNAKQSNAELSK